MPNHPKTINITSFKGLNNVNSPENTDISYLKKALNVNIDKTGNISKRKGYTKKDTAIYTSLWYSEQTGECYAVRNGDLVRLFDDYSFEVLDSNIGPVDLSFEEVDGTVYFTSDNYNGIIEESSKRNWGLEKVNVSPGLSIVSGNLPEGTYQVSYTYVSSSGRESGTSVASYISVPENSGIQINIPTSTDPSVSFARVYCSTQNGTELFFSGVGFLGGTYIFSNITSLSTPLRLFNIDSAPKGHIVRYYKGRLFIAQDNILWYSEPFQYEFFRLNSNYIEFPTRISEVMPVEDGIWVGADRLYYISGDNPSNFKRVVKETIRVVEGTSCKISGSYIRIDNTPIGYKWLVSTNLGIFVLFNQGMVINLTSEHIALDQADSGTAMFIQDSGLNQYISILKTNERPNNSVFGDLVEATIIRNGNAI